MRAFTAGMKRCSCTTTLVRPESADTPSFVLPPVREAGLQDTRRASARSSAP